jgi:hypothetical protein
MAGSTPPSPRLDETRDLPVPTQLLGRWRLHRHLVDRRRGLHGRVAGLLVLARDGGEVRWQEQGTLRWAGTVVAVSRLLRLWEDEDGWRVHFADGRYFHPWRPGSMVEHLCRDDLYRGLVAASASSLRTLWDVTGPGKDQRIVTRCVRA